MTKQKKLTPVIVGVVLLGCLAYAMLPFEAAGGIDCGPALFGADAKEQRFPGLTDAEDCQDRGKSRLTIAASLALIATVAGAATLALKPVSRKCFNGEHDQCRAWQPMLGSFGSSLACQCECHGARR